MQYGVGIVVHLAVGHSRWRCIEALSGVVRNAPSNRSAPHSSSLVVVDPGQCVGRLRRVRMARRAVCATSAPHPHSAVLHHQVGRLLDATALLGSIWSAFLYSAIAVETSPSLLQRSLHLPRMGVVRVRTDPTCQLAIAGSMSSEQSQPAYRSRPRRRFPDSTASPSASFPVRL